MEGESYLYCSCFCWQGRFRKRMIIWKQSAVTHLESWLENPPNNRQRGRFYLPDVVTVCSWFLFLYFNYAAPVLFLVFCKFLVWLMPFWDNSSFFERVCEEMCVYCMHGWITKWKCKKKKKKAPPTQERDTQAESDKTTTNDTACFYLCVFVAVLHLFMVVFWLFVVIFHLVVASLWTFFSPPCISQHDSFVVLLYLVMVALCVV